jgi:hypothetical protein
MQAFTILLVLLFDLQQLLDALIHLQASGVHRGDTSTSKKRRVGTVM